MFVASLLVALSVEARAQDPPVPPQTGAQTAPRAGGQRPGRGQTPVPGTAITNQQIQELFDAWEVNQVQAALRLTDAEYLPLYPRLRTLQLLRRQHRNQRQRALSELRSLVAPNATQVADDPTILAKIKTLDEMEDKMAQDERQAIAAIDQVLTPRQRAHFRAFEEQMERKKIDLLVQARTGGKDPEAPPKKK